MQHRIVIAFFLLTISWHSYTAAQQYGFRNYSLEQGLPQTEVYAVIQDSRGNIWTGTNGGGLSRFNGRNFVTYTTRDGLLSNMVWSIFEDSRGNLWLGTSNAVTRYDGISFKNYSEDKVTFFRTYQNFHEDQNGDIWVISNDEQYGNRLLKIENDSLVEYTHHFHELTESNNLLAAFSSGKQGNLYLTYETGLFELQNNEISYSILNESSLFNGNSIYPVHYDSLGTLWILTIQSRNDRTLFTVSDHNITAFKAPRSEWWNGITGVLRDRNNRLWINNYGNGIAMMDLTTGETTFFNQTNGLPNDFILSFMEDFEGNIWMGTQGGGLIQYSRNNFIAFSFENIINGNIVRTILQDSNGNYWFGLSGAGIVKYDGIKYTAFSKDRYPGLINVRDILELDNKHFLILTFNGLYMYNGSAIYPANEVYGFENPYQFSDVLKNESTIWLATRGNGVFRISGKEILNLNISDGSLPSNQVHSLYKDDTDRIWICTNNGISVVDDENIITYTTDNGLNNSIILQITQDHLGRYWMATFSGGINILDGNQFRYLTTSNGLTSDIIYSILRDHEGNIWAGTQNGVDRITISTSGDIINIQHFGKQDGFTGIENNGAANLVDKEGNLWFGTVKGAMKYDPGSIQTNPVRPFTQITGIRLFYRNVDWRNFKCKKFTPNIRPWNNIPENFVFPYDSNHLSFEFEALSYIAPEKVKYQWKLEGLDKNWSPITSNTEAVYPKIPPGDYTFMVQSINNDGVWSKEPALFSFKILHPWWNTIWFYILAGFLALLLLAVIFRLRVRIIEAKKKELEALVREKTLEVVNKNQLLEQQKEEIQVQAENLQKSYNNLERLTEIGKIITSQLTVEKIVDTVYESINELMDATVFGIGMINEKKNTIDFHGVKEKGETIEFLSFSLDDNLRLSTYCVNRKKEIFINDFENEYKKYLPAITPAGESGNSSSIIYVPLMQAKKVIGVITVQSFRKNAYSEYHLSILRNLAVYARIALENTVAYKKIQEQTEHLKKANEDIIKKNLEIEKVNTELLDINNEKNNLIGILAHDLRNPLTSSLSIASNLANMSENQKDDYKESVNFLLDALNRMNNMIAKILDIRMIEQKKINLNCERIDFDQILREVYNSFLTVAKNKRIRLELESYSIYGIADRNYLTQVFENLLSNAVKFSPPNKKILTRMEEKNGEILISFRDEGPGLTKEDNKKLFKPFQRLSAQPTAGEKSTGLGLSIVKKYVDLMGGRVWCESEPGKGANFTVAFQKTI